MAQTRPILIAGGGQPFQSGRESAGSAGLKWMDEGIDPKNLFPT